MIPIVSDECDLLEFYRNCDCEDGCPKCQVVFKIEKENVFKSEHMSVSSNDLVKPDGSGITHKPFVPVRLVIKEYESTNNYSMREHNIKQEDIDNNSNNNSILVTKLGPSQELKAECIARKSVGKEHAKWSSCVACTFKHKPKVTLFDSINDIDKSKKINLSKTCPTRVFSFSEYNDDLKVENMDNCMFCEECTK